MAALLEQSVLTMVVIATRQVSILGAPRCQEKDQDGSHLLK